MRGELSYLVLKLSCWSSSRGRAASRQWAWDLSSRKNSGPDTQSEGILTTMLVDVGTLREFARKGASKQEGAEKETLEEEG